MLFSIWFTCLLIHLGLTMAIAFSFSRGSKKSTREHCNAEAPFLSVVVAAKNEYQHLKKLVPALLKQDYASFEVIIALDRCTDKSQAYLAKVQSPILSYFSIDSVPTDWNPKKNALQRAVSKAKGTWIVFTDGDCKPLSDKWLSALAQKMYDDTSIVIGYSPYQLQHSFLSHYVQFEAFKTGLLYLSAAILKRPYMAVGRNLAIRTSFFERHNGYESFKSEKGGDDDLFIQKYASASNTQVALGRDALVETYPAGTWRSYFQQKRRHLSIGTHYKWQDQVLLSVYHTLHALAVLPIPFLVFYEDILPAVLLYLFIKFVAYTFVFGKIGAGFNTLLLPFVDILYAMLIPFIATWTKFVKDTKWKN